VYRAPGLAGTAERPLSSLPVSAPGSSASRRGALARARARWFRSASSYWRPDLYERYFTRTPIGSLLRRRDDRIVHAALDRLLEPDQDVLEVGSGTGHYTLPVARRCRRVVALDAAPEMVDYLRARAARQRVGNVETAIGMLPDRLGAGGPFDGAVCLGVLGYVADLESALRALADRLRPGGWAIFSLPPRTVEGRLHEVFELAGRRRVSLRSPAEAREAARRAGLRVLGEARAGLSSGGITLLVEACRADAAADAGASAAN
jgi:SAM-dependent methyltransferase